MHFHIYIGGPTPKPTTHWAIRLIKIRKIHKPYSWLSQSVNCCEAHSNRKVRWDGVIGVVFSRDHLKNPILQWLIPNAIFIEKQKRRTRGLSMSHLTSIVYTLGKNTKKCHKFVPTMRETENYILPSSGKSELDPCQLDSNFDPLTVLQTPSHALLGTPWLLHSFFFLDPRNSAKVCQEL